MPVVADKKVHSWATLWPDASTESDPLWVNRGPGLFSGLRNSSGSDRGIRLSEILFEKIELLTPRLDGSDQLPAIHHYADYGIG